MSLAFKCVIITDFLSTFFYNAHLYNMPAMPRRFASGLHSSIHSIGGLRLTDHRPRRLSSFLHPFGSFLLAQNSYFLYYVCVQWYCLPSHESVPCFSDMDECASGLHNCNVDATCDNTAGSFDCKCNTGYTGNGMNCTGRV